MKTRAHNAAPRLMLPTAVTSPRVILLILDDLGAERSTDYGFERIYSVCDARYNGGKPVIYTTNLSLETLKRSDDLRCARIYDRVLERCYPVEFRGVSRRKRDARRGFEEMNKLLGI